MRARTAAALLVLAALACSAAPAVAAVPRQPAPHVLSVERLSPRLLDFTMRTPELRDDVHTRVLLPDGYDEHPGRRYPVLWLLHGGFGSVRDWTEQGAAERLTAGLDLIVVMPEDGNGGWYTDWHNGGRGGPPRWETFHLGQLLPWVDDTFRTVAGRDGRAVAGLSTGGFGAIHYAARHPDLFAFAASFSGALDVVGNLPVAMVIGLEAMADGGGPDDVFGNRLTHEIGWRAGNPVDLAANLRGVVVEAHTGNGRAGELDPAPTFDPIEHQVREMSLTFHRRMRRLGLPHLWDDYGPGTHTWPYWRRALQRSLPRMLATFEDPPAVPSPFSFRSADRRFTVHGWRVVTRRREVHAFTSLADVSRRGFRLTSAHAARVRTAPVYAPRSRHQVTVGGRRRVLRADRLGRLHVEVPLAPADAVRGGARRTVTVSVVPAPPRARAAHR